MSVLPTSPDGRLPTGPTLGDPTSPDDFVHFLSRGSDLLMEGRVVEAKEALERALYVQPQDAKGQDLLAGVYFRLGVYPRAIEIWNRLVAAYPRDPTLRVNLALALLKTAQPQAALAHIHESLAIAPDHDRAWGYLGLIHWRLGQYSIARDAFLRGGQTSMAKRMDELLTSAGALASASSSGTTLAPPPAGGREEPLEEHPPSERRATMRAAADLAISQLESEIVPLAVERSRASGTTTSGEWHRVEPGNEPIPHRAAPSKPREAPGAPGLDALINQWELHFAGAQALIVGPGGHLYVNAKHEVATRLDGLLAIRGEMSLTPIKRRARGRELDELIGGTNPLYRWRGPVSAVFAPKKGSTFIVIHLEEHILYAREDAVFAFDDRVQAESGRLPIHNHPVQLVQAHGGGIVVLEASGPLAAVRVVEGEETRVAPSALVGWIGRLLPSSQPPSSTQPYSLHAPPLVFRGEGAVIVQSPE